MIDFEDSDDVFILSLLTEGPLGIILLIAAIVILFIAFKNDDECKKMPCPTGAISILSQNKCLCVFEAN